MNRKLIFSLLLGAMALAVGTGPPPLPAQTANDSDEIRRLVERYYEAWNARDIPALVDGLECEGVGYGARTQKPRDASNVDAEACMKSIQKFCDSVDYWQARVIELHTSVQGDVGLAWGVHEESFRKKGRPSERMRIRFTHTYRKVESGWAKVMFHRDAQRFNEKGLYLREFTEVSSEAGKN